MTAVLFEGAGSVNGLVLADVPRPNPEPNEVLVRVHAATVTRGDVIVRKLPIPVARLLGIRRKHTLGPRVRRPDRGHRWGHRSVRGRRPCVRLGDLTYVRDLMSIGAVRAVVDRRYRLGQIPEAYRYVERGHKRGNVVVFVRGGTDGGDGEIRTHEPPFEG